LNHLKSDNLYEVASLSPFFTPDKSGGYAQITPTEQKKAYIINHVKYFKPHKYVTIIIDISNVNNIMSHFLYQLPSHLWDGLMAKNILAKAK
jgi:hypothetical protein